jgi:hypothetical protein
MFAAALRSSPCLFRLTHCCQCRGCAHSSFFTTNCNNTYGGVGEAKSKSLADAVAFKERLLLFDKTSAARTQVYTLIQII